MRTADDRDELEELCEAFEEHAHKLHLEFAAELRARGMNEDDIHTELCWLEVRLEHELLEQFAALKRGFNERKRETRH